MLFRSLGRDHLVSAKQLRRLIAKWIPIDRFEQSTLPLCVVTTDALSGEAVVITQGEVGPALAASSAIPGIFPPVCLDGRWLIDGSMSSNFPVLEAQELGAEEIYLVTTATAPRTAPPRGAIAVAMNSVSLLSARVAQLQLIEAQRRAEQGGGHVYVVPSGEPFAPGPFDYRRSTELAEEAYRRTRRWLAEERQSVGSDQPKGSIAVSMTNDAV